MANDSPTIFACIGSRLGLGIEAHELGTLDLTQPSLQCGFVQHHLVVSRDGGRSIGRSGCRARTRIVEGPRERAPGAIGAGKRGVGPGLAIGGLCIGLAIDRGACGAGAGIATGAVAKPLLELKRS